MATPVDPDFRARLAALNEKFAATVPGTLAKIRAALDACLADSDQPAQAALHQLHEVLHGVAGSAGTFGYAVFGQESRRVEQMVRAVLAGSAAWPPVVPEVEKLLAWALRDAKAATFD
ncbi:chemotaxis protein histidine kinase CheA [Duganella sp. 1224]|uniref:Hpt domain-containing protein n=1 Tax=Duganella sp. 1224 TaxID=2587052 RepID=UPI0015C7C0BB|nr:Hpt domain-containing protein [Duganella sp. 1224]NYE60339.1 chemotaxis protein histidine kinase CheA [Duganella sp. 1224]